MPLTYASPSGLAPATSEYSLWQRIVSLMIIRAVCDTQIVLVDLQGNKITEKAVEVIVGCLKTCKTLKTLDLSNNGIGSRLMKNKLKNALPHIDVLV